MKTRVSAKNVFDYKANFLWPFEDGSLEEAGFEFANARTEKYQRIWWRILLGRLVKRPRTPSPFEDESNGKERT